MRKSGYTGGGSLSGPLVAGTTKRVAIWTHSLGLGGAERWCISLARNLPIFGVAACLVSPDVNGALAWQASRVAPLLHPRDWSHEMADVALIWGPAPQLKGFAGPIVGVAHGSPNNPWIADTMRAMEELVTHRAAVSYAAAKSWGCGAKVIWNGADVERVGPSQSRQEWLNSHGIPDSRILVYCGRLSPEKRPEILPEILANLPGIWRLVMVCPDNGYRATVEAEAEKCGVADRVHWILGQDYIGDALGAADCFILPSATEGFPLALIEAWLAGVPAVCSRWGVAAELTTVFGNVAAWCTPDVPACAWADTVIRASEDRAMADYAKAKAWKHLTASNMARSWAKYIQSI